MTQKTRSTIMLCALMTTLSFLTASCGHGQVPGTDTAAAVSSPDGALRTLEAPKKKS